MNREIEVIMTKKKNPYTGSNFEDFLAEEGILEECRAAAIKFTLARELERTMKKKRISKAEMARRLHTSRSGLDRLLDPENTSLTLHTLAKVAAILGQRISMVPA
ncbi:MAG: XRE family transcriptional regulator [Pseudomonadota bacterium]|nr:XRE family transcriptional regulator [Pseudomonadota bacterium]MDE3038279.1 XRE family transcriptional regulator [Pseudomonadota bacterium]